MYSTQLSLPFPLTATERLEALEVKVTAAVKFTAKMLCKPFIFAARVFAANPLQFCNLFFLMPMLAFVCLGSVAGMFFRFMWHLPFIAAVSACIFYAQLQEFRKEVTV